MESWVEALRSDADSATSRAIMALERVGIVEAAARQSQGDEIRARTDLQVKVESIASLEATCHALRADLAKVRGALVSKQSVHLEQNAWLSNCAPSYRWR